MNVDEFKKLKDGDRVYWTGFGYETLGTFHCDQSDWWVNWDKHGVTPRALLSRVDKTSDYISRISLPPTDKTSAKPSQVQATVTVAITIPEGYESTGEFRQPVISDHYLHTDGIRVVNAQFSTNLPKGPRLILRKKLTLEEKIKALADDMRSRPTFSVPAITVSELLDKIVALK